jgi:protein-tyrosine phosphatase
VSDPEVKTSETSPIRVDFVDGSSLGLTFAPGKKGAAQIASYVWDRDVETDVRRLREHYEVDSVVTLIEEHEFDLLAITDLRDTIRSHGMMSHWFPIPDGGVPGDMAAFMALLRTIVSALRTGSCVVVHCRGGLGRAGTVASCVLVMLGEPAEDAIHRVRQARPNAIENERQEAFVIAFEKFHQRNSGGNNAD